LSHWNLRDEIKADYSDPQNGFAKQKMIQQVMERIVTQTIPLAAVNNPGVDWNPVTNDVMPAAVKDGTALSVNSPLTNAPEPNTRYAKLLLTFQASRKADPYSPTAPNPDRPAFRREPGDPGIPRESHPGAGGVIAHGG
jgi:hypothetical protein